VQNTGFQAQDSAQTGVFGDMPTEGTPTTTPRSQAVVGTPLHECPQCCRPFVVPTNVLKVVTRTSYRVELSCANCGWSEVATHDEDALEALDRTLDRQTAEMEAALEIWKLTREIEQIDAFAKALRDDLILPEDF
jgi:hypothetical protein